MSESIEDRTAAEWKILIAEYESRTVTCGVFCKERRVSKGQIYKWRRHFLSECRSYDTESAFIPLAINSEQESGDQDISNITSALKIRGGSGVAVEFDSGCTYLELKAIMGLLYAAK